MLVARSTPRVIFTADDFGMAVPVNEAVERAHRDGILTTASLMVVGAAVDDAVARARRLSELRVGLHLALVHERPLLAPREVPDLVDADGRLPSDLARAGVRWFAQPGIRRQLEAEIRAQFVAFAATGLRLDHVNAHAHMHVHPTVFGIVLRVAREYGRPPVRLPRDRSGPRALLPWLWLMAARARRNGLRHNDYVCGLADTGSMRPRRLRALLAALPPGTTECYFHIATRRWDGMSAELARYAQADELSALLDPEVAALIRNGAVRSTTFDRLD